MPTSDFQVRCQKTTSKTIRRLSNSGALPKKILILVWKFCLVFMSCLNNFLNCVECFGCLFVFVLFLLLLGLFTYLKHSRKIHVIVERKYFKQIGYNFATLVQKVTLKDIFFFSKGHVTVAHVQFIFFSFRLQSGPYNIICTRSISV